MFPDPSWSGSLAKAKAVVAAKQHLIQGCCQSCLQTLRHMWAVCIIFCLSSGLMVVLRFFRVRVRGVA